MGNNNTRVPDKVSSPAPSPELPSEEGWPDWPGPLSQRVLGRPQDRTTRIASMMSRSSRSFKTTAIATLLPVRQQYYNKYAVSYCVFTVLLSLLFIYARWETQESRLVLHDIILGLLLCVSFFVFVFVSMALYVTAAMRQLSWQAMRCDQFCFLIERDSRQFQEIIVFYT